MCHHRLCIMGISMAQRVPACTQPKDTKVAGRQQVFPNKKINDNQELLRPMITRKEQSIDDFCQLSHRALLISRLHLVIPEWSQHRSKTLRSRKMIQVNYECQP